VIQNGRQPIDLLRANISWGGLGGYTRDLIEEGESVLIEIFFVIRSGETVSEKISGKVAWAHQDGNFNAFGIAFSDGKVAWAHQDGNFNAFGIAFSDLAAGTHPQLVSYLQYTDQFD